MNKSILLASFASLSMSSVYRNAETGDGNANTAAPAAPKLTADEKFAKRIEVLENRIQKDTEELAEVKLERETAGKLSGVTAGTMIVARLGRAGSAAVEAVPAVLAEDGVTVVTPAVAAKEGTAGTLKHVTAEVLGVKDNEDGSKRYKIAFGDGFDADTVVIQPSQIIEIVGAADAAAFPQ